MYIFNRKLSIRNKIIYIIVFCSVFFILSFYFISSVFLLESFSRLEHDQVLKNIDRVKVSMTNVVENQSTKLKDWAYWDDTYKFVEDKNQEYIESNLTNESLVALGVNLMVFINTKDEIVFSKFVDIESGEDLVQDKILISIKENFNQIKDINDTSNINNIIKFPEGDMVISVDQILKSDQSGLTHGTIIFGSYIDDNLVEKISSIVGFPTFFYSHNSYSDMNHVNLAKSNLSENKDHYIHTVKNSIVHGYFYLKDIFNEPVYMVEVELPRDIYNQGRNMSNLLLVIMFFTILLLDVLIAILLEKFIIKRLIKLEDDVVNIGKKGDFSKSLSEDSDDEIGGLSNAINLMLDKVQKYKEKEEELDKEQKLMNEKMKAHGEELEKINKLMLGRELKMIELKKENSKLKGESEKN